MLYPPLWPLKIDQSKVERSTINGCSFVRVISINIAIPALKHSAGAWDRICWIPGIFTAYVMNFKFQNQTKDVTGEKEENVEFCQLYIT